jgi:hypothetical protein
MEDQFQFLALEKIDNKKLWRKERSEEEAPTLIRRLWLNKVLIINDRKRAESFVFVESLTKTKLICCNVKYVDNGIISNVSGFSEMKMMLKILCSIAWNAWSLKDNNKKIQDYKSANHISAQILYFWTIVHQLLSFYLKRKIMKRKISI